MLLFQKEKYERISSHSASIWFAGGESRIYFGRFRRAYQKCETKPKYYVAVKESH